MFRSRKLSYSYPSTTGRFNADYADLPLKKLLVNIPVTQTGSGTPSPDNVRDFIGVSGVTIGQTSGYGEYFKGLLNGTYGFVDLGDLYDYTQGSTNRVDVGKNIIQTVTGFNPKRTSNIILLTSDVFEAGTTITSSTNYIRFVTDVPASDFRSTYSGVYLIYELETPVTPTITPEQFATLCQAFGITGNTYSISFGQTVYSANLDVLTGKLYLTHELKTIDENSLIDMTSTTSVFYWNDFFDIANDTESVNCNCYYKDTNRANPNSVSGSNHNLTFCCRTSAPTLYIKDTRFTSIEDYKTWLSTHPVQIAVKLATPIEIPLGGIDIKTLQQGINNIFADIGTVETQCIKLGG